MAWPLMTCPKSSRARRKKDLIVIDSTVIPISQEMTVSR